MYPDTTEQLRTGPNVLSVYQSKHNAKQNTQTDQLVIDLIVMIAMKFLAHVNNYKPSNQNQNKLV